MPDELKRYRRELKKFYKQTKSTKVCEKCGAKRRLQYHHINKNSKKYTISYMVHHIFSKEEIEEELTKCILVCSRCHKKIHKINSKDLF